MKILIDLSQFSEETRVKMAKEATDAALLDEFAKDTSIEVLCAVAENFYTNPETLDSFSKSKVVELRKSTAKNVKLLKDTIIRLANDSDKWVRYCVATTPYEESHREIIMQLSKDSNKEVRQGLVQYGLLHRGIQHDEEILSLFLNDEYDVIRGWIARLTSDHKKLEQLSRDEDWRVRSGVIHNPVTSKAILKKMENDPNGYCKKCVYQLLKFGEILWD